MRTYLREIVQIFLRKYPFELAANPLWLYLFEIVSVAIFVRKLRTICVLLSRNPDRWLIG